MLRKLLSTLSFIVVSTGLIMAQAESAIKVTLTDKSTKETIPFANVTVDMGGLQVGAGTTDMDGELTITPLNPGKYTVKATFVGYQTVETRDVMVTVGKTVYLKVEMNPSSTELAAVEVVDYSVPLIDPNLKTSKTVDAQEYQNMATKNINSVAASTAGVYQSDEGSSLNIRGQRSSGTSYFVDGQKVIGGTGMPQGDVEQITVITAGVPAEYGDATGGLILATSKGPSAKYSGYAEVVTSGLGEKNGKNRGLDAYGYNMANFSLSGPLKVKKDSATGSKKAVLGFNISGQISTSKDGDPSAIGSYQLKKETLEELEQNPLRKVVVNGREGYAYNALYLTSADIEKIKARNGVRGSSMILQGRISYQPTTNLGVVLGGSLSHGVGLNSSLGNILLNTDNNSQTTSTNWRVFAKLTQKFNSSTSKEEEKSSSVVKNAYFTILASYEKSLSRTEDAIHKDRLFDYGYIGKFEQERVRDYNTENNNGQPINPIWKYFYDSTGVNKVDSLYGYFFAGYNNTSLNFTPSDLNAEGAAYTKQSYQYWGDKMLNIDSVRNYGGLLNGSGPANIYGLFSSTGAQTGTYAFSDNSQFRVSANFSASVKKHKLQTGFEYEQRVSTSYSINALSLWSRMRQWANFHIRELDNDQVSDAVLNTALSQGGINYYDFNQKNNGSQSQFDKSLREKLGYDVNGQDYLDIDAYDPSTYSVDMFSADELLNIGGASSVSYRGYDYTGKKIKGNTSIDDFLTKKDDRGNYMRNIGAYRPIYIAGYLQDQFDIKDLKIRVGVRVDRFDANQKVLKDKYLMYEAKTAGEFVNPERPSNIGDDFVVYVKDVTKLNSDYKDIVGYRNGDVWYNKDGVEVSDPKVSFGGVGGQVQPALADPSILNKGKENQLSSKVFTDYVPQINVMPRIAFAFPVSDVAELTANYDLLTQRPPTGNIFDVLQYYNEVNQNSEGFLTNPDLKPEKRTNYEIGFQQVLNEKKNSSIKISAFYSELKDMLNVVNIYQAYPRTYNTYGNIDFGTIQGLSLMYDLRRTPGGVQINANYTLQFANGTGSSASDGINLLNSGVPNLRTTHALDFDQRHNITITFDYRFGSGKEYKGPHLTLRKGKDNEKLMSLFEGMGANIQLLTGSGTPYSKEDLANNPRSAIISGVGGASSTLEGDINGSRLPWTYRVNLRVDKKIDFMMGGKKEGEEKRKVSTTIYLQVLNLLNTKNIQNVYKATGSPDDDGYLASSLGQAYVANLTQGDRDSFTYLYNIRLNNPGYFSRARVIRLGLMLNF